MFSFGDYELNFSIRVWIFFFLLINISVGSRHIFKNNDQSKNFFDDEYDQDQKNNNKMSDDKKHKFDSKFIIKNVHGLYVCDQDDKICQKISELIIPKNLNFDCFARDLPISYHYQKDKNNTVQANVYLVKDKHLISAVQKISKVCYQIKK